MNRTQRTLAQLLMACLAIAVQPGVASAQAAETSKPRDGQHDFDFSFGTWKTHVKRLVRPLTGSKTWTEYDGMTTVRKIWNGRASLSEIEADGPAGHLENLALRLYNPESGQWSLNYANSREGVVDTPPTIGRFENGRGEFFDMEVIAGKNILVRNVWSDISSSGCRFEQAFSEDGGKTWEPNWIATFVRAQEDASVVRSDAASTTEGGGQHDFDFNIGTWKTHQSRLLRPLTGSHTWVEYDGTDVIRPLWGGRANIGEIEASGPAGRLELLSLRLYNPKARQWSFIVAQSASGVLATPAIGELKNGRGAFIDQEQYNGRTILVRFAVSDITRDSCRFEQAFSDDGGKTWEVNFIVKETRVRES